MSDDMKRMLKRWCPARNPDPMDNKDAVLDLEKELDSSGNPNPIRLRIACWLSWWRPEWQHILFEFLTLDLLLTKVAPKSGVFYCVPSLLDLHQKSK